MRSDANSALTSSWGPRAVSASSSRLLNLRAVGLSATDTYARAEGDARQREHDEAMAAAEERWRRQLDAYKAAAADAAQQCGEAENELQQEREGVLETLTK